MWEYLRESAPEDAKLERLGAEGWELVAILQKPDWDELYIFKRPKMPERPPWQERTGGEGRGLFKVEGESIFKQMLGFIEEISQLRTTFELQEYKDMQITITQGVIERARGLVAAARTGGEGQGTVKIEGDTLTAQAWDLVEGVARIDTHSSWSADPARLCIMRLIIEARRLLDQGMEG